MHGRRKGGGRGDMSPPLFEGWGTTYLLSPPLFLQKWSLKNMNGRYFQISTRIDIHLLGIDHISC